MTRPAPGQLSLDLARHVANKLTAPEPTEPYDFSEPDPRTTPRPDWVIPPELRLPTDPPDTGTVSLIPASRTGTTAILPNRPVPVVTLNGSAWANPDSPQVIAGKGGNAP